MLQQNDYKLANEVERDIQKYEQLIQQDTEQISEMNKRIVEDYSLSERERGLQIKKVIYFCSTALAKNAKEMHSKVV